MKKLFCLVIAVCLLLAGCTGKAPASQEGDVSNPVAPEEKIVITFVTPLLTHPVWLEAKVAFEEACSDYGVTGQWVGPTVIDVNEMIKQIDIAIASKVDGIITMAISPEAMIPALDRAAEAGIPVVLVVSDAPEAQRLAYLGLNNENFGKSQAETALEGLDGRKPVVAAMVADLTETTAREILESAEATFAANGEYVWATSVENHSDTMKAVTLWENIFSTYPDVNVVLCTAAEAGAAAAKVMVEKGLEGEVIVVGISVLEETADYIRDGVIYATMSENFPRMGYQPVSWLCDYIRDGVSPSQVVNDTGTVVVKINNLDTYESELVDRSLW